MIAAALLLVGAMVTVEPVPAPPLLAQVESQAAEGEPLCGVAGRLYACSDVDRAPICWDAREQQLVACSALPKDKDGTLKRSLIAVGEHGWDTLTTGITIHSGRGVEGNTALPTPEIRLGAKTLSCVIQIGLQEFAAHVLHKPKLANGIAIVGGVYYGAIGFHNLSVGRR